MFTGTPGFRFRGSTRQLGGVWWLLMAPGLALIAMAIAIMVWPELLAYLVAGALLLAGISLTTWGWSVRQVSKRSQRRDGTVYYEVM